MAQTFTGRNEDVAVGADRLAADLTELYSASGIVMSNPQTGTAYTLVLADKGKTVEMNNAAANTLTVPPNSAVAFPVGTILQVYQAGVGQTTVVAGTGVTVRNAGTLRAQYSTAALRKRGTDEWVLSGDLT